MAGELEAVMVVQPEFAEDDEADQPDRKFRAEITEPVDKFGCAAVVFDFRDGDFDDEKLEDDGENTIA